MPIQETFEFIVFNTTIVKSFKLLRAIKLLRIVKISKLYSFMNTNTNFKSEYITYMQKNFSSNQGVYEILKNLLYIIISCH